MRTGGRIGFLLVAVSIGPSTAAATDLSAAIQFALAVDPLVASATAARDAAQRGIDIARARLLPQVNLQATNQALNETIQGAAGESAFNGRSKYTQISLRQTVLRQRDALGLEIARLQAKQAEAKLEATQAELFARTAAAWFDVLGARAARDSYRRLLETAAVHVEQEQRRLARGEGTRDALVEAEAQRGWAEAQLADAEFDLAGKLSALALTTGQAGMALEDARLPPASALDLAIQPEAQLRERVQATNPELAAARIAEQASAKRVEQAASDHWPTLDVVAARTDAENDSTNTLGLRYRSNTVGVQLTIPIFSGGAVDAAGRQAEAARLAAQADVESVVQRLKLQFAADWAAQAGLSRRAMAAFGLVEAAREQLRAIEANLRRGFKTLADLATAEQQLARREADLASTLVQCLKAQARVLALLPIGDLEQRRWMAGLSVRPSAER